MKERNNRVFIASSLDGYIADKNGGIDWLHSVPQANNSDMGYGDFISKIDAIVMGRKTFETVCRFDTEWPYKKPVFVLSNTLTELSEEYSDKAYLIKGSLTEITEQIYQLGYYQLYIDGGVTIQNFLKEDLIDSITITIIPKLLGGGFSLFADLPGELDFECTHIIQYSNKIIQNTFSRKRK